MIERVKQAAAAVQVTTAFSVVNASFNAIMILSTFFGAYYLIKSDVRDQNTHISAIESVLKERASDHDRIVDMAADVRWLRIVVEKRADSTVSHPLKPIRSE